MSTSTHTWNYPIKNKTITFCVTCRNRLWQLKQTLNKNLEALDNDLEITLVDYGSSDEISDWVWNNFKEFIVNEKLNFFEVKNEVSWNISRAKNLAHRISNGQYLFNLDADNFITPIDIKEIRKANDIGVIAHQWSGKSDDGSCGRIGCHRDLFFDVGGYDEALLPMGYEDVDLLVRLKNIKTYHKLPAPNLEAINNSFEESISEVTKKGIDPTNLYKYMISLNKNLSKFRLSTDGSIRNTGFTSYKGLLNGEMVIIDGFGMIRAI